MTSRALNIALVIVLALALVVIGYFAPRASAAERFLPGAYNLNAYRPVAQYANPREPGALGPQNVVRIETYDSRCDPIERGPQ